MNSEIKAQWVEALRSGNYKQGRGFLHSKSGTYCCLGVLCDIKQKDVRKTELLCGTFPNYWLLNWAELDFNTAVDLALKNDNGVSFEEIADWIETNL